MTTETRRRLTGASIALFCFVLYVKTLCPTTDFIDAGELSTVAYTLGIAHPTGYPMFTLVGWLFSHLPLPFTVVFRLNLMAATLCAAAIYIFFRFLLFFDREILSPAEASPAWLSDVPAATGALILGLSETYWAQAVAVEVYSLHVVFLASLLLLFTRAVSQGLTAERAWYAFAFVLGLAFTNHMTTILLAPGFLFLYFSTFRFGPASWRLMFRMALPFLAGLSLYLYLPFRALQGPVMLWGNPVDPERFFWHFTGKQYRVWIFSSTESAAKQMNYFLTTVGPKFVYLPLLLAAAGILRIWRSRKQYLVFTLLLFFGCLFYAINYDIHDIDSYFLLAYFTIALWSMAGTRMALEAIRNLRGRKTAGWVIPAAVVGLLLTNYSSADESSLTLVESYTHDMFGSLEPNSIILSYQWDYFVSAANYFQIVEHERPDVVVIDKELLRRSWYFKQMQIRYPGIYNRIKPEIEAFLEELYKFEHDIPYNPSTIEGRYNALIHSIIDKNLDSRPVYVTPEVEEGYLTGFHRVPVGLAMRLYRDEGYHPIQKPHFSYRIPPQKDRLIDGILGQYARAYINCSYYIHLEKNDDVALELVKKGLEIDPAMPEGNRLREILEKGR